MITQTNIWTLIVAYLLGSIPTAIYISRYYFKIDIREYGSGNAGATNAFRVLGKKAGSIVLLIDVLKGFGAVNLVRFLDGYIPGTEGFVNLQLVLGVCTVLGHIFPIFAGFQGGKGVATTLGVVLGVHPAAAGISATIFLTVLLLTRYVSLSSMLASIAFPLLVILAFHTHVRSLKIFSIAVATLVVATHQRNIERLVRGVEHKANLFGGSKEPDLDEEDEEDSLEE